MTTEYLTVVDENDQPVNTLPRDKIHARGLRHRAVHILVFNQQQQLFLQKRSMLKDLNKGLWDSSAAGHVDSGEHYDISAIRETREELGIDIADSLQLLFKLPATKALGMEFIQVYRCLHNGPFQLNSEEIDQGCWLEMESISQRVSSDDPTLTETFKNIWQKFLTL